LFEGLTSEQVGDVLDYLSADDPAEIVSGLHPDQQAELLALMEPDDAAEVRDLLSTRRTAPPVDDLKYPRVLQNRLPPRPSTISASRRAG
jgi:flagellar motility protein MotE (MotC chaperone)